MSEQDSNIKKLQNRDIFAEIKERVSQIKDTASENKKSKPKYEEEETYEELVKRILS